MKRNAITVLCVQLITLSFAQSNFEKHKWLDSIITSVTFRSIGPAFMSGRVSDIAIHPNNPNIWYVAHGSSGVWKTENSGTTWKPIFEKQKVYSIGCIAVNPSNPHEIWLGTGENVGGRHVGFGDGVYKSLDDGKTWINIGLKKSEHISKIVVHPNKSKTIWVASQGPLWSKGGERGIFKSNDGGLTWKNTLSINPWTGATDLVIDPRNPDILYAATWQRHRTIAAYMGGGVGSALYKSIDGGESWKKIIQGLPNSRIGKIGLAISPQNPDVLYAALELDRRNGAVFRSSNRGENWIKMSNTVSGGTGPHYYQELYASPHHFDKIYLANVRMLVSKDGGKTFSQMNEKAKHSDNHALVFKKDDPNYRLVGTDGGLYQSFDGEKTWSFIANLPTLQYYKVAVDDQWPFYNIYGGTQDNNTHGGPSKTDNIHGIRNADWFVPLSGDGHQPAVEPKNHNILYAQWQQGNLSRVDLSSGETTYIQPQNLENQTPERYNWDAPILISSHKPNRIFFASQHLWKSEDRGDSWLKISPDLTNNVERFAEPIMEKVQSFDNAWDVYAMSTFSTITSIAESPLNQKILCVGTDDGLIQLTKDGGLTWNKIQLADIKNIPHKSYINDIKADLFDENTFYVALDNHKEGDYKPYLIKTTDGGKTWETLASDLPNKLLIWRIVQDHLNKNLFFLGTEFGLYISIDGGLHWSQMTNGIPTIPIRDLVIQKQQNDLIAASFGRGFFILDDYSFFRGIDEKVVAPAVYLNKPRDGLWYVQKKVLGYSTKGSQGEGLYQGKNPPFGVTFNYLVNKSLKTLKQKRKEKEKELKDQNIPFLGWDYLEKEMRETPPKYSLHITNPQGEIVRKYRLKTNKGFHQITWDMKYPSFALVDENSKGNPSGFLAAPGKYCGQVYEEQQDLNKKIGDSTCFMLVRINKGQLQQKKLEEITREWREVEKFNQRVNLLYHKAEDARKILLSCFNAYQRSSLYNEGLFYKMQRAKSMLDKIDIEMKGYVAKNSVGEKNDYSLSNRIAIVNRGIWNSTYGLTLMQQECFDLAKKTCQNLEDRLKDVLNNRLLVIQKELEKLGAPKTTRQVWY